MKLEAPFEVIKVNFKRHYKKLGYIYRKELINDGYGTPPFEITNYYDDKHGYWIGFKKEAMFRIKELGITEFSKAHDLSPNANIGFSPKDNKWYGWSHRATVGYGIGYKVTKDDLIYTPTDKFELVTQCLENVMQGSIKETIKIIQTYTETEHDGVEGVSVKYSINERERLFFAPYPIEWGKGEYTIKTLEEAKEASKLFARRA